MVRSTTPPSGLRRKWWLFVGAVGVLIAAVRFFRVQDLLKQALEWVVQLGPWGPVIFIALYVVATVFFVPGSVLTLGAGAVSGRSGVRFMFRLPPRWVRPARSSWAAISPETSSPARVSWWGRRMDGQVSVHEWRRGVLSRSTVDGRSEIRVVDPSGGGDWGLVALVPPGRGGKRSVLLTPRGFVPRFTDGRMGPVCARRPVSHSWFQ